jgi:hypothetical protein
MMGVSGVLCVVVVGKPRNFLGGFGEVLSGRGNSGTGLAQFERRGQGLMQIA